MKKYQLEKELKALGAKKIKEGSKHEKWVSKHGRKFILGRHNDIPEPTARAILAQAKKR